MTGNQIGCVLLYYILKSRKMLGTLPENGAVVKSVVSTELARRIADSYGLTTFDTLTGFKFIAEKIQQFEDTGAYTFVFGFEESYGFLSSTFVRDKDGVNASLLIAEAAVWAKTQGKTLYDILMEIYQIYGAYVEKVVSVTLPGKDGLQRMQEIMQNLRAKPPRELASLKVLAVRDYLTGERTDERGGKTALDLPHSNVLYFELEGGAWVCIRPSGTEPKIKLYVEHERRGDGRGAGAQRCAAHGQRSADEVSCAAGGRLRPPFFVAPNARRHTMGEEQVRRRLPGRQAHRSGDREGRAPPGLHGGILQLESGAEGEGAPLPTAGRLCGAGNLRLFDCRADPKRGSAHAAGVHAAHVHDDLAVFHPGERCAHPAPEGALYAQGARQGAAPGQKRLPGADAAFGGGAAGRSVSGGDRTGAARVEGLALLGYALMLLAGALSLLVLRDVSAPMVDVGL